MSTEPDGRLPFKKRIGFGVLKAAAWAVGAAAVLAAAAFFWLNGKLGLIRYEEAPPAPSVSESRPSDSAAEASAPSRREALPGGTELPYDSGGVFQMLLIGSDARAPGERGRSDSMILVSMNRKTSKITVTSLLRDIYLKIPGIPEGNRLNAANAFGGPALLLETIRRNFGITVGRYVSVDYGTFIGLIDRLGGVEAELSDEEIGVANGYIREMNEQEGLSPDTGILGKSGVQTLNGKQALSYARIRYVGNGDFDRTRRQRLILQNILSKLTRQNVLQFNALMNDFLPEVTTNLTRGEVLSLILAVPSVSKEPVEYCQVPADGTYSYRTVRGMSVLEIDLKKNAEEMRKKIYGGE